MHEYESSTGTQWGSIHSGIKAQVLENFINHQFNRFSSCAFRSRDTQQNAFDMIFYLFFSCFVYIHLITKLNWENKCQNIVQQSFRSFSVVKLLCHLSVFTDCIQFKHTSQSQTHRMALDLALIRVKFNLP